eukprot:CAMPEP_0182437006 /NCGR_PEP_ID=MMETSP1167-20130531/84743_1 /TAXON_ID=2988 /ORGANISM="Mallomonas Sp, Strain CCMP3275" /LENGTH=260 /DNA_ID=CAMNT_0024629757 /DNA_START=65 /DNA_END=848 /DNA_ORIENTATION=+
MLRIVSLLALLSVAVGTTSEPTVSPTDIPTKMPSDDDDSADCFSAVDTVQVEVGGVKQISDVRIGDRVLSYSSAAKDFVYSTVVAVPHEPNSITASFIRIATKNKEIKMTPGHLIFAGSCGRDGELVSASQVKTGQCVKTIDGDKMTPGHLIFAGSCGRDGELVSASQVKTGQCVKTIDGEEEVMTVDKLSAKGIYTVITNEEYVVVSGFVASPYAISHTLGNLYYNVHRALFYVSPNLVKSQLFQSVSLSLAEMVRQFS